jgi:hypothetical protein
MFRLHEVCTWSIFVTNDVSLSRLLIFERHNLRGDPRTRTYVRGSRLCRGLGTAAAESKVADTSKMTCSND